MSADSKPSNTVSVRVSNDIKDIIEINQRSAHARSGIRIIELSDLGTIIPFKAAETIRRQLLKRHVPVKQLTNHRSFASWTKVNDFVDTCLDVRVIDSNLMNITVEILIFDDIVAFYQVKPEVVVTIIENAALARQHQALFDGLWGVAEQVTLNDDGSTTYGVTINRTPEAVFTYISNFANWPEFSDFAANFERVTDDYYIAHTAQGDIGVQAQFDKEKLLLDTIVTLPDGSRDLIPYRVVPNKTGAELIMTNFKPRGASRSDYDEQLTWMAQELTKAKTILEREHLS